ncbi:MAG: hypothetical protein AAF228_10435 [Pseudomonadota bacterium]
MPIYRLQRISKHGFALITVIWSLGLLSLLVINFVITSHSQRKIAHNMLESAKAEALANAGVRLAILDLVATAKLLPEKWRFPHNGLPVTHYFNKNGCVEISVHDEESKIDLNTANEALLIALFKSIGMDHQTASNHVDRMIDFRDYNNLRRVNGAEQSEYKTANLKFGPKNFIFQHVSELDQVFGFSQTQIRQITPLVTVHSKRSGLDFTLIPKTNLDKLAASTDQATLAQYNLASRKRVFSITAHAKTSSLGAFTRKTTIELTNENKNGFKILSWQKEKGLETSGASSISHMTKVC